MENAIAATSLYLECVSELCEEIPITAKEESTGDIRDKNRICISFRQNPII